MKVYVAGPFSWKEKIAVYAAELRELGIVPTSRWLHEKEGPNTQLHEVTDQYKLEVAEIDLTDIKAADLIVLFSIDPTECKPRGGRHVESGIAIGLQKPLIVVGPKENIFHYLPQVLQFSTWEEAKEFLKWEKEREEEVYGKGESSAA